MNKNQGAVERRMQSVLCLKEGRNQKLSKTLTVDSGIIETLFFTSKTPNYEGL